MMGLRLTLNNSHSSRIRKKMKRKKTRSSQLFRKHPNVGEKTRKNPTSKGTEESEKKKNKKYEKKKKFLIAIMLR